jgi:hypothetical protein
LFLTNGSQVFPLEPNEMKGKKKKKRQKQIFFQQDEKTTIRAALIPQD